MKESKDPLTINSYISFQHIHRYKFAVEKCKMSQRILDIGSGSGYGSMLLSRSGAIVIGCDLDLEQVIDNRLRWNYDKFIAASALELPFSDATFDAVVSFETIEHVFDGKKFLNEIERVIRPGGTLICSTPNIKYENHPPYHVKEYGPEEFFQLFESQMGNIERYAQYFKFSDYLKDLLKKNIRKMGRYLIKKDTPLEKSIKHFVSLLTAKLSCKNTSKGIKSSATDQGKSLHNYECMTNSQSSYYYRVLPYLGSRLLRIVIAVGTCEGPKTTSSL